MTRSDINDSYNVLVLCKYMEWEQIGESSWCTVKRGDNIDVFNPLEDWNRIHEAWDKLRFKLSLSYHNVDSELLKTMRLDISREIYLSQKNLVINSIVNAINILNP